MIRRTHRRNPAGGISALKFSPFRAMGSYRNRIPGRCPGLSCVCLSGKNTRTARCPKGLNMSAQGNALGNRRIQGPKALKGRHKSPKFSEMRYRDSYNRQHRSAVAEAPLRSHRVHEYFEQPVDFAAGCLVQAISDRPAHARVLEDASLDEHILFDRQKRIEARLQRDQRT